LDGAALVIVGGTAAIVIEKACVALGNVPLAAVTVPVYVPGVVGVPERTPADVKVSPGGSVPVVSEKVIGVVPLAV
jgi:hypothetical protein